MNKEPKKLLLIGVLGEQIIYYSLEEQRFFCTKKGETQLLAILGSTIGAMFFKQVSQMVNEYVGVLPTSISLLIIVCLTLIIISLTIIKLHSSRRKLQLQSVVLNKSGMKTLKTKLWFLRGLQWIFLLTIPITVRIFINSSDFVLLTLSMLSLIVSTYFIYEYGFWR